MLKKKKKKRKRGWGTRENYLGSAPRPASRARRAGTGRQSNEPVPTSFSLCKSHTPPSTKRPRRQYRPSLCTSTLPFHRITHYHVRPRTTATATALCASPSNTLSTFIGPPSSVPALALALAAALLLVRSLIPPSSGQRPLIPNRVVHPALATNG